MKNKEISKRSKKDKNSYMTAVKDLEHKIENMIQDMWHNTFHRENAHENLPHGFFGNMPKLDIIDREKEVFVKAELPGIEKKDLDISIANNQLVIKAKTCHEEKEEKGDYLKREISKSEVYRSILLPADIDESNIKTSFKNGVLKLTIPKQDNPDRKTIEVK